jgi:transposase-like protein
MNTFNCPAVGRDHLHKDGHNRSGTQRYRCRACRRSFTLVAKRLGHGEAVHG